jgi:hypothetical protein
MAFAALGCDERESDQGHKWTVPDRQVLNALRTPIVLKSTEEVEFISPDGTVGQLRELRLAEPLLSYNNLSLANTEYPESWKTYGAQYLGMGLVRPDGSEPVYPMNAMRAVHTAIGQQLLAASDEFRRCDNLAEIFQSPFSGASGMVFVQGGGLHFVYLASPQHTGQFHIYLFKAIGHAFRMKRGRFELNGVVYEGGVPVKSGGGDLEPQR